MPASRAESLGLRFQNSPDFAIHPGRVLDGSFDEACPFAGIGVHLQPAEKVGSLQNGFERVAQIVSQGTKLAGDVGAAILENLTS